MQSTEPDALYYAFVEEVMRRGTSAVAARLLADDFVAHDAVVTHTRDEFIAARAARHARLPDAEWTIELLVNVGGMVVCHAVVTAPAARPPVVAAWETVIARIVGERIAECWCACDARLAGA